MVAARGNLSVRRDIGVRGVENLHALFDQAEVDLIDHGSERDKRRAPVADLNNLVCDRNAFLRARGDRRGDQAVQRIRTRRQRLLQHLIGKYRHNAALVVREGLPFRVKALLLGGQHAHAIAGGRMRLHQMVQRILFSQGKRRRDHQHMPACGQRF